MIQVENKFSFHRVLQLLRMEFLLKGSGILLWALIALFLPFLEACMFRLVGPEGAILGPFIMQTTYILILCIVVFGYYSYVAMRVHDSRIFAYSSVPATTSEKWCHLLLMGIFAYTFLLVVQQIGILQEQWVFSSRIVVGENNGGQLDTPLFVNPLKVFANPDIVLLIFATFYVVIRFRLSVMFLVVGWAVYSFVSGYFDRVREYMEVLSFTPVLVDVCIYLSAFAFLWASYNALRKFQQK